MLIQTAEYLIQTEVLNQTGLSFMCEGSSLEIILNKVNKDAKYNDFCESKMLYIPFADNIYPSPCYQQEIANYAFKKLKVKKLSDNVIEGLLVELPIAIARCNSQFTRSYKETNIQKHNLRAHPFKAKR